MAQSECPYCGGNQVPHFTNWYFESINVLFTPLRQAILFNPLTRAIKKMSSRLNLSSRMVSMLHGLRIIDFQDDVRQCRVMRAQVLWEDAQRRGLTMRELLLFGRPFDVYMVATPGGNMFFSGLPRPKEYDDAVLDTLDDKLQLKHRLQAAGLPVPQGGSAFTFRQAKKIFNTVTKPVIVKPRAGSRGRHTSTYIYTEQDLKKAFKLAKQLCAWVMIEEHLRGPVYRGTVINYKTIGVNRGEVPQVVGDGVRTITELVYEKNKTMQSGVGTILLDNRALEFLARQNLIAQSVPANGQSVPLLEKIGVSRGGFSREEYDVCHPDNIAMFEAAAKAAGDPILGFDFIIEDIRKSYKEQRCGFLEVNTLPFIDLHHHPLEGTPRNVAAAVWELVGM